MRKNLINCGYKFNITDIAVLIILFLAMRLESIGYIIPFSSLYYVMSFLLLIYYMELTMLRSKLSIPAVLTLFLFGVYFLSTFINTGTAYLYSALRNTASPMLLVLISDRFMRKQPYKFLKILYALFILLIITDIISMFLYPDGMYITSVTNYKNNWFLGYKSARVRSTTMTAIAVAGILDVSESNRLKSRFFMGTILAVLDTYMSDATAGVIALLLESVLIWLLFYSRKEKFRKKVMKLFDIRVLLLIILLLNLSFVIFQNFAESPVISYILTDILKKDLTITHRTQIWAASLQQFFKNPVLGNGYIPSKEFISITAWKGGTHPHNLLLALLVYTGIVGFLLYLAVLIYTLNKTSQKKPAASNICAIAIIVNLVFGITSMNMFGQYHYAIMIMLYYFAKYEKNGKDVKEEEFN